MAFIPIKMDDTQIAFLANEVTKSYMTGKNAGSQEEYAREYYNMYLKTMQVIAEEQRKRTSGTTSIQDLMDDIDSHELDMGKSDAGMFR